MICRILLLIILTSCVSGSFAVNVTKTYQAEENGTVNLEWTFIMAANNPSNLFSIICEKEENDKASVLYHVRHGVEVSDIQDKRFSGRVQSDKNALREGRIRLQLSRLRTDDSGLYLCEVNMGYRFQVESCQLNVTAGAVHSLHKRSFWIPQSDRWERTTLYPLLGMVPVLVILFSAFRRHKRLRRHCIFT